MAGLYKEFSRLLVRNGYVMVRRKGSHDTYKNDEGRMITINLKLNEMVARRLIKENNLKTNMFAIKED